MNMKHFILCTSLSLSFTGADALAGESFTEALTGGKWSADLRARYENVEQADKENSANAKTFRARVGYETGKFYNFSGFGEIEFITHLGDTNFDDGINGKSQYPRVGDADDEAINQLYLSYEGLPETKVSLGRFKQNFDNQRFIGSSNFRQNDSSYDGFTVNNKAIDKLTLDYSYINKVHRSAGSDSPVGVYSGDVNLLHAKYAFNDAVSLTGYGYLLGFEGIAEDLASQTYGLRLSGSYPIAQTDVKLLYAVEGALQSDMGDNPNNYSEMYYRLEPGIGYGGGTYKLIYEVLGGDGVNAVQTPLAAMHSHNGWADQFRSTPGDGLRDVYLDVAYKLPFEGVLENTSVITQIHDYRADKGNDHYGHEWGLGVEKKFGSNWTIGAKYADYNADTYSVDTQKTWVYTQFTF